MTSSPDLSPPDAPLPAPAAGAPVPDGRPLPRRKAPAPALDSTFPVVCLGGSAGSLQALERFFRHLPPAPGMAFVVVTHQSDQQESGLVTVLRQFTQLPVHPATDGLRVQPNHVYVNPPGPDLGLLHGALVLLNPTQPTPWRLPIDYFLQRLAKDVGDRAVAIILSGTGSDGAVGLKMVMENFGMVMAQDPDLAEFGAMPRAAIATGFVDFVLSPESLAIKLVEYAENPLSTRPQRAGADDDEKPTHALQKISALIRAHTGHDFSYYKRNTVLRRIERRMNAHQIKDINFYVRYLQEHPPEVEALFKELLIGVTKFFRDPDAFDVLKVCLTPALREKAPDSIVRVWAPGCSTGEEAYSLAMVLMECLAAVAPTNYLRVQIFATDISPESIDYARAGIYPANIEADVSPERLNRFFTKLDGAYQIRKEIRDLVVFALHNVNKDAPFIRLDLLVCRNLLIYLSAELQKSLLPVFHYALNPGGLLFLGPSENLTGFQDLFEPIDVKWKISRRNDGPSTLNRLAAFPFVMARSPAPVVVRHVESEPMNPHPATPSRRDGGPFTSLVQRLLLRTYAPPAVVINAKGDILYVNGRTGRYLEPAPGLSGMNLFEMAREELNFELSNAIHQAPGGGQTVRVENVRVKTDGGYQLLNLTVRYLEEPEALAGLLLVAFEDVPTPRRVRKGQAGGGPDLSRDAAVAALDKELQYTKHRLQTTIEEMESSLEELKSTNEELQSANEELQSTNEEAMTNKEEMQSLNEELMTLNMQYQARTEELAQSANDMKNLLDSTEIAIIFLDNEMVIKRFTPPVARIINLVPADVGRPISHFASNLRYERLLDDVQQVLHRLTSTETNIQSTTGEWYAVRILPYRTLDNYISGAVITFTDITGMKQLQDKLQESARFLESLQETVREPVMVFDADLRVYFANSSFAALLGEAPTDLPGRALAALAGGTLDQPALRQRLLDLLAPQADAGEFDDLSQEVELPGLGRRRVSFYGRRIVFQGRPTTRVILGLAKIFD